MEFFAVTFKQDKIQKFLKMEKKIKIIFKFLIILLISSNLSKAELLEPKSNINPSDVIRIQLLGLQKNDYKFKDSGIEQTWNFAHPNNKKVTGPLNNFKRMIKGDSYQMMINHLSHTITQLGSGDKWAQFEVIILDKEKIYHKFNWQVEKYTVEGPLKDCWLTTMVSSPVPLGSSI
tara:strand:+ start:2013 stop:2540 length:528 start_codon:yes stop_codon:yes gene_type:complete